MWPQYGVGVAIGITVWAITNAVSIWQVVSPTIMDIGAAEAWISGPHIQ